MNRAYQNQGPTECITNQKYLFGLGTVVILSAVLHINQKKLFLVLTYTTISQNHVRLASSYHHMPRQEEAK